MAKWGIIPANQQAADEAALLFKDEEIKLYCNRALKLLAKEDDPTRPNNPALNTPDVNVGRIEHDAPSWYKLRVQWNHIAEDDEIVIIRIRIIFSLSYVEDEQLIEYKFRELPFEDADNNIVIEQIGHRTANTYIEARRRWRKSHHK